MSHSTRRVGIAEAKARMAEIVRNAATARTVIQRRGDDVAVIIGIEELRRLEAAGEGATDGARLLRRLDAWRDRTGGVEVDETTFPRAAIAATEPFASSKRSRRRARGE